MTNDSVVRVRRWYRVHENVNPQTGQRVRYEIDVDWDLGSVDGGEYYVAGAPSQLFAPETPIKGGQILVAREQIPTPNLSDVPAGSYAGLLHFKNPNI